MRSYGRRGNLVARVAHILLVAEREGILTEDGKWITLPEAST
jgi:hypothetical protein